MKVLRCFHHWPTCWGYQSTWWVFRPAAIPSQKVSTAILRPKNKNKCSQPPPQTDFRGRREEMKSRRQLFTWKKNKQKKKWCTSLMRVGFHCQSALQWIRAGIEWRQPKWEHEMIWELFSNIYLCQPPEKDDSLSHVDMNRGQFPHKLRN